MHKSYPLRQIFNFYKQFLLKVSASIHTLLYEYNIFYYLATK